MHGAQLRAKRASEAAEVSRLKVLLQKESGLKDLAVHDREMMAEELRVARAKAAGHDGLVAQLRGRIEELEGAATELHDFRSEMKATHQSREVLAELLEVERQKTASLLQYPTYSAAKFSCAPSPPSTLQLNPDLPIEPTVQPDQAEEQAEEEQGGPKLGMQKRRKSVLMKHTSIMHVAEDDKPAEGGMHTSHTIVHSASAE